MPIVIYLISEMTKRAASYDIDPYTFEEKEKEGGNDKIDFNGPHMEGRKVFKIQRQSDEAQSAPESKPSLNIPGLNPLQKQAKSKQDEANPQPKPSSLFSNSLFNQNGTLPVLGGLFSKEPSFLFQQKPDEKKNGDQASRNPSSNVEEKDKPKTSLFSGSTSSLFGSGTSLFQNNNKGALFSSNEKKTEISSLFGPKPQKEDDDNASGDSAELEKKQNMEIDPTKSTVHFQYKQLFDCLKKAQLSKFKKDSGQIIDTPMKASLLYNPEGKSYHIQIQSAATLSVIYSGLILPKKSQFRNLHGKSESIELRSFKIDNKSKKMEANILKILIINEKQSDGQEFSDILKQIIDGTLENKEQVSKKQSE